jgi:hypothetical protein
MLAKNSSWQAKHSIQHIADNGDRVTMREDFAPNFGDKRTVCCITTTQHLTLPFSPVNFFMKSNMIVVTHPSYFFHFPRLKVKLKDCHFDPMVEVES